MAFWYDADEPHPFKGVKETYSDGEEVWVCKWCDEYEDAWQHEQEQVPEKATRTITHRCDECGFSSTDLKLVEHHSCDVQQNGGHCEDWPACSHEWGDCNGLKYGSDEAIKEQYYALARSGMDDYEIDMYYARMDGEY